MVSIPFRVNNKKKRKAHLKKWVKEKSPLRRINRCREETAGKKFQIRIGRVETRTSGSEIPCLSCLQVPYGNDSARYQRRAFLFPRRRDILTD